MAILETRKAVSNSFVNNDYLDPCGTGKTHFTAKAKFPHKNIRYKFIIWDNLNICVACFSGMGGGNGEGMGGLLTDEEISKHQVNNIILSFSCMLSN